jgi:uncharacterized protein YecE (DUF72 family)
MQVWIGTSGYAYHDWTGPFYPQGLKPTRMLAHYCQHFPLVELNFTFYRLPTPEMLARLAEQTPAGFQFLVKLPRTLSHEENRRDLSPFRLAVDQLMARGQLLGLLCQLPQATHQTASHKNWLDTLALELAGYRLAIEFRHHSWFDPNVTSWLAERGVDLVSVDVPDLARLYPRGLVRSSPRLYVRFHSRNADNWYRSDKDRYDFDYSDTVLDEWADVLAGQVGQAERVLLLFNNCQRSQAAANAQRMRELLRRKSGGLEIVEPFAAPEAQQRLLFE